MTMDDPDTDDLSKEGKILLSILSKKLDEISDRLDRREELLVKLEQENLGLKKRVSSMEDRIQLLENQNRRENLILSGRELLKLPSDPNIGQAVTDLLRRTLHVEIPHASMAKAHRIGVKPHTQGPDARSVLVKFTNSVIRNDILASCRRAKPTDLFANEDLTATNATILFALRQAKRKFRNKVTGCGSIDGRTFLYLKPPNESERKSSYW